MQSWTYRDGTGQCHEGVREEPVGQGEREQTALHTCRAEILVDEATYIYDSEELHYTCRKGRRCLIFCQPAQWIKAARSVWSVPPQTQEDGVSEAKLVH